ncbi:MAG: BlaI/MecI/CopY family transcriptional regulator [Candidatus Sumerlaeota bacterium]|nr:BlaI/MecI/CopY family transcriptional regulator [Candidatus Sumerlaeota bacterium]
MPRRPKPRPQGLEELTPLETEIMQVVWDCGDATAAEIAQTLRKTPPLADTTIYTVLARLRKKGYIAPIPTIERSLRFAPVIPREQVGGRSLRGLLQDFFGNSPRRLLAHLLQAGEVDEKELAEIRKLLKKTGPKEG